MKETRVQSLGWEDPLEEEMAPTPVFLPGESHGQRSLVSYSPRGCKESDTTDHTHTQHTSNICREHVGFTRGCLENRTETERWR